MEKTDRQFWASYWGQIELPQRIDLGFKNDRVISDVVRRHVPGAGPGGEAFEVGCAPGRWLVFLYEELGYRPCGYEYVEAAAEKTEENLRVCGVPEEHFSIARGDFIQDDIPGGYDLVISLGFVEHFDDFDAVLDKHAAIVNPGGYLVVGLPSFRGLNRLLQERIDRRLEEKMLPGHNLAAMDLDVFGRFADRAGLETVFSGYVGGFEPGLFDLAKVRGRGFKKVAKLSLKTLGLVFGSCNAKVVGSYILNVFRRETGRADPPPAAGA